NGRGAAWVFTRNGDVWTEQGRKLVGSGGVEKCSQGESVALSADGNTAIVGGMGCDAAWVFTRTAGVWKQQGNYLRGTGAVKEPERPIDEGGTGQGRSVALSANGNTAIIGGPWDSWPGAI